MNCVLRHTSDQEISDRLFQMLDELEGELETAKKQAALDPRELAELQALHAEAAQTQIKSVFPADDVAELHNPLSWDDRFILDALQLQQRALECKSIQKKVFNKVKVLTKGLKFQEERIADVKGMQRAHVKLRE